MPPGASVDAWREALRSLSDEGTRRDLAAAGRSRVHDGHSRFVTAALELTS